MGKVDGPDRPPGIPGKGQSDGYVPVAHLDDLVKNFLVGTLPHMDHVVKHEAKVKGHEPGQRARGPGAQNVNLFGVDNGIHRRLEAVPVNLLHGQPDLFHVRLHHRGDHVLVADDVIGHLNALDRGEFIPNHFLQGLLHGGIPVVLQLRGKAHHGGFTDVNGLAQLAGRHKRRLVVGGQDVVGNELLPLGKGVHFTADER